MTHIRSLGALFTVLFLLVTATPSSAHSQKNSTELKDMAGQMLMVGFRGYCATEGSPIMRNIRERNLGGVIIFAHDVALKKPRRNIQSPQQLDRLTTGLRAAATIPLLIAIDQEGGRVQRLKPGNGFANTPSAQRIGASGDVRQAWRAGEQIGSMLSMVGFNLDFAPVVDVNENPRSPVIGAIGRSFSSNPNRVAAFAERFINGLHAHGVLSCIKHFPGHGSAGSDSHLGVTDVTRTWKPEELIPYRTLIEKNKPDMIMTAHIFNAKLDPKLPATLSKAVITGMLRDKLDWQGVVITDDLDMKAVSEQYGLSERIRLAIQAGADILLFGNNLEYDPDIAAKAIDTICNLVESGAVPEERIRESYERIMKLKKKIVK